jgi:hypothetical protein
MFAKHNTEYCLHFFSFYEWLLSHRIQVMFVFVSQNHLNILLSVQSTGREEKSRDRLFRSVGSVRAKGLKI